MIIVLKPETPEDQIKTVVAEVQRLGFEPRRLDGVAHTVIACIGDERGKSGVQEAFEGLQGVEKVVAIMEEYKLVASEGRQRTIFNVDDVPVGGDEIVVIAGPCSVETEEQIVESARAVARAGARMLRGGAFKPRTSPYAFQGHGEKGLQWLQSAKRETSLPIVTEVMTPSDVELVARYADVLQIGARNVQNYHLLREVRKTDRPVLLKRGMSTTLKEFLMAAEYVMSEGNPHVIMCERGIRTFETATRNTLDLNAVPVLKEKSHLPVAVDPSHGVGIRRWVPDLAVASVAVGADVVVLEVHPDPDKAWSDGSQTLSPELFMKTMDRMRKVAVAVGRNIASALPVPAV